MAYSLLSISSPTRLRMRVHLLLVALPLLAGVPASAQYFSSPHSDSLPTLVASATAEVLVRPDRAIVFASISERDTEAAAATAAATATRNRALRALREIGVADERVSLWGAGMGSDDPRGMMRPGGEASGSAMRFGVRVVVDPIARLDDVLAALARAGVESVPLIRLEHSNPTAGRDEATVRAVAEARAQAEAMANAAGVRLGELRGLATFGGFEDLGRDVNFFQAAFMDRGGALAPQDVKIRVTVQGTWRIAGR
jgi:uncharacterized protein